MKKWAYLVSGIAIGALVATSGSAFADQVKSLVGQKVTGEYKVIVNGKELQDKGAVIAGKTNAPVRALSEALGANLKVEGKTINITTDEAPTQSGSGTVENSALANEFSGWSQKDLETKKESLSRLLQSTKDDLEKVNEQLKDVENMKKYADEDPNFIAPNEGEVKKLTEQVKSYEADIAKYSKQLEQINEALNALEK